MYNKYFFYFIIVIIGSTYYSSFLLAQQEDIYLNLSFSKDTIEALTVKENLLVNSLDGEFGAYQSDIQVAMSGNGTYAFCWEDYRNGVKEIYYQFFDRFGNKINTNIKIDSYGPLANTPPTIAANQNGIFVIAWVQSDGIIVAQRFNSYLVSFGGIGGKSYLNNLSFNEISNLSIAVNSDSSFLATWVDKIDGNNSQIKSEFVRSDGYATQIIRTLNSTDLTHNYLSSKNAVTVDKNGNYFVTWYSYKTDSSFIYMQKIGLNGQIVGTRKLVSSTAGLLPVQNPQVSYLRDGIYLVAWETPGQMTSNYFSYRLFNSSGIFLSDVLRSTSNASPIMLTSICSDHQDNFYLGYIMNDDGYVQKISSSGILVTDPMKINYDAIYPPQKLTQDLSDLYDGNFIIAYDYNVSYDVNVGFSRISSDIINIQGLTRINNDSSSTNQTKSSVKFNSNGDAIIVWQDERNGKAEVYARSYDSTLLSFGDDIQITDSVINNHIINQITIETFPDGSFLVAFFYGNTVLLQKLSSSGERIGNNIIVGSGNNTLNNKLYLQINSNDDVLISWYNEYDVSYAIYNKSLALKELPKSIKHSQNNILFKPITVSVDTSFNIFVAWRNYDQSNYNYESTINGEFYNSEGEILEETFNIADILSYDANLIAKNDGQEFILIYNRDYGNLNILRRYKLDNFIYLNNSLPSYSYNPFLFKIINFENHKSFISYTYYNKIFGIYFNDSKRDNKIYLLSDLQDQNIYQSSYSYGMDLIENKILISKEFDRDNKTGFDIYATEVKINKLDFNDEYFYLPVKSDVLYTNFPNPFNSKTKIVYELLAYHNVKLAVYNVLGEEVKVLVNQNQDKGIYEVEFDASTLASGVYFYRLDAFDTTIKKMIILK